MLHDDSCFGGFALKKFIFTILILAIFVLAGCVGASTPAEIPEATGDSVSTLKPELTPEPKPEPEPTLTPTPTLEPLPTPEPEPTPEVVSESEEFTTESLEPSYTLDDCVKEVKSDFQEAQEIMQHLVKAFEIMVDEDGIAFFIVVDSTDKSVAVTIADFAIRSFGFHASELCGYSRPTKDYYGSVFDEYEIYIVVAPFSDYKDIESSLVEQYISPCRHTPVKSK